MAKTLKELYGKYLNEFAQISHAAEKIDETEIYEEANPLLQRIMCFQNLIS